MMFVSKTLTHCRSSPVEGFWEEKETKSEGKKKLFDSHSFLVFFSFYF